MRLAWLNAHYDGSQGFGVHGLEMLRALVRKGVNVVPLTMEQCYWPGWLQQAAGLDMGLPTVIQARPTHWPSIPGAVWGFCMYEATGLPPGWAERINARAERLLVPSPWLIEVFEEHGVRVPIHFIPEGIDPASFPYVDRSDIDRPYTFLVLADRVNRKGWDVAWRAFWLAFGDQNDVRFLIKRRPNTTDEPSVLDFFVSAESDRRIRVWTEDVPAMADIYAQADCFVFPSRGEGWGLPPREAAATGLPVIATAWSGLEVGLSDWAYPLRFEMAPSMMPGEGDWAEPDVRHLAELMRYCYDNRAEARMKGRRASAWLHENQTWDHAAAAFIELLETTI